MAEDEGCDNDTSGRACDKLPIHYLITRANSDGHIARFCSAKCMLEWANKEIKSEDTLLYDGEGDAG